MGITDSSSLRFLALGNPVQEREDVLGGDFANLPVGKFVQENAQCSLIGLEGVFSGMGPVVVQPNRRSARLAWLVLLLKGLIGENANHANL